MKQKYSLLGMASACLAITGCGLELRKDAPNNIHLERVFAPVKRFDCQGRLVSSRIEEVSSPSRWVRIESDDRSRETLHADIENLSLRTRHQGLLSYGDHSVSFQVHISSTWLAYRVKKGRNVFAYKLYESEDRSAEPYESGEIELNVSYSEKHENETWSVHPSPGECENTSTP